tara:strand:+ start:76338 stop:76511 length:174 start_codon:yes stop_codon:yes gene_type:complete
LHDLRFALTVEFVKRSNYAVAFVCCLVPVASGNLRAQSKEGRNVAARVFATECEKNT